jgi:hypothetical protein
MCTVYATIGNSDDKLSQAQWFRFTGEFLETIKIHAAEIHGVWWSAPDTPWQNCCIGFAIAEDNIEAARTALTKLREFYGQEAIAWVRGHPPEMI